MISLRKPAGKHKKIGLIFLRDKGLNFQILPSSDQHFIPLKNIGSKHTISDPSLPKLRDWILIIPAYLCFTRYITVPSSDQAEIEKILEFQLPEMVLSNTQPWCWDFTIIDKKEDGSSKTMVVLSPQILINRYIKKLLPLKIKPAVITTSVMYLHFLLSKAKVLPKSHPVGCFYFDDDHMDFFVVQNDKVIFVRGLRVTDKADKNTNFVGVEIRRSISILTSSEHADYPKQFFAIGSKKTLADFTETLKANLDSPVNNIEISDLYNEQTSRFLRLASEKTWINLLPKDLKKTQQRSKKHKQIARNILKVCFVLVLAFLCLKTSIWRNDRLLQRHEQRLNVIRPMAQKLQFLRQQLRIIENQIQGNISMLDVISELYKVLPKEITIHYLFIEANRKALIRAQAGFLSQAFDCISLMEQSGYFSNVRQNYANQRQINDSVLIDFEITADINPGRKHGDKN